jgi:hypothetical protein
MKFGLTSPTSHRSGIACVAIRMQTQESLRSVERAIFFRRYRARDTAGTHGTIGRPQGAHQRIIVSGTARARVNHDEDLSEKRVRVYTDSRQTRDQKNRKAEILAQNKIQ